MNTHSITLSRGKLDLIYESDDFALTDLLDFAERINPKRAFLFVSKVLGRHIPVAPSVMRHAFGTLANKIPDNLPTPIVIIGMAETAVGLSAGVHDTLKQRYEKQCYEKQHHEQPLLLNSTRHEQKATLLTTFSEDHSHASCHLVYLSDDPAMNHHLFHAKTLIMVDDEASTANTCINLVNALIEAGMTKLEQVHLTTLVDWSLGRATNPFGEKIAFFRHHLLSGRWTWTDTPCLTPICMPDVATVASGKQSLCSLPSFGRTPTYDGSTGFHALLRCLRRFDVSAWVGKNVLVLGSNEFVWLPFLLAEHLEQQGIDVKFGSLTRSPIAKGGAIQSVMTFRDHYGLGMTNFIYNVNFDDWAVVLLCIETAPDSVDDIWRHDKVCIISPMD